MSMRMAASCVQPLQESWLPRGARTTLGGASIIVGITSHLSASAGREAMPRDQRAAAASEPGRSVCAIRSVSSEMMASTPSDSEMPHLIGIIDGPDEDACVHVREHGEPLGRDERMVERDDTGGNADEFGKLLLGAADEAGGNVRKMRNRFLNDFGKKRCDRRASRIQRGKNIGATFSQRR